MWMTRVSITHPVFATMVMVGLTVLGLFSYARLGVEPMPDVNRPAWRCGQLSGPRPSRSKTISPNRSSAANTVAGVKRILSRSEGRS
jgi:multidrug efflux pump subunit AcrB